MHTRLALTVLTSCLFLSAVACGTSASSADAASASSELTELVRPPALPQEGSVAQTPWGGADASRWRTEAVIANAASAALNEAWRDPATRDAIAAVPVAMLGSNVFPYGDGQSNASPSFLGWPTSERPPVVATLIRTATSVSVVVRLDRTLPTTATQAAIRFAGAGGAGACSASLDLPLTVEPSGDRVGRFLLPAGVGIADAFAIVPAGWRAGFAVSFLHPTKKARALQIAGLLDREDVSVHGEGDVPPGTVDARLRAHAFTSPFNNQGPGVVVPYANTEVHATFPAFGQMVRTGVGGGRTWVYDERPSGYKTMYQCFDGRDPIAEASGDGGVPSATGWHAVGDKAETAVNDLEAGPMLVGFAARNVLPSGAIGPDGFAWHLEAVTTMRWLMPGEALVSPRGSLHWFAFSSAAPTCVELVVSPESASLEGYEP